MSLSDNKRRLIWHGVLLVLLGLFTGVLIPLFTNSRMGLSAHLAGVQNGMLMILLGLVWVDVKLAQRLATATFWLLLYSMYAISGSLFLAAAWGTSRSTPIAGIGHSGAEWQELVVSLAIRSGSVAMLIAVVLVLYGLGSRTRHESP